MKRIRRNDYYTASKSAYFSYMEVRFLLDFYLPLIGPDALSTYLRLQEEVNPKDGDVRSFDALLNALRLSCGEFEAAMNALEATGLVRSFVSEGEEDSYFVFLLSSPLSPAEFIGDPLLYGTLRKYVGDAGIELIERRYRPEETKKDDMVDITTSFKSYFSPDFTESYYGSEGISVKDKRRSHIKLDFDKGKFEAYFLAQGEKPSWIGDDDFSHIEKVSALYGYSEETAGSLALDCFYFESGKKVFDRRKFENVALRASGFSYMRQEKGEKSQVSGETRRANSIRLMDQTMPAKYLSLRQGGHAASPADLKLVQRLALNYGLPNPVINACIAFCLEKCDNTLPSAFVEKVAASLQRAQVKSARDAMEFLLKGEGRKKKLSSQAEQQKQTKTDSSFNNVAKPSQNTENKSSSDNEEEDLEEIMRKLKLYEESGNH